MSRLTAAARLCQRSAGRLPDPERRRYWFALLERAVAFQQRSDDSGEWVIAILTFVIWVGGLELLQSRYVTSSILILYLFCGRTCGMIRVLSVSDRPLPDCADCLSPSQSLCGPWCRWWWAR